MYDFLEPLSIKVLNRFKSISNFKRPFIKNKIQKVSFYKKNSYSKRIRPKHLILNLAIQSIQNIK